MAIGSANYVLGVQLHSPNLQKLFGSSFELAARMHGNPHATIPYMHRTAA
jgi:hypothetical protein